MNRFVGLFAIVLLLPCLSWAEDPPPTKFYKLDFVIQELDGAKVINSREYSAFGAEGKSCSIRASSQVALTKQTGTSTQVQTYDVGVQIDASPLKEVENGLTLTVMTNVSSLPPDLQANSTPVIRHNSWNVTLLIPLRKATVIFSSDDVSSKHKIQMVLTATPIK